LVVVGGRYGHSVDVVSDDLLADLRREHAVAVGQVDEVVKRLVCEVQEAFALTGWVPGLPAWGRKGRLI
jgi:hypothetical protein